MSWNKFATMLLLLSFSFPSFSSLEYNYMLEFLVMAMVAQVVAIIVVPTNEWWIEHERTCDIMHSHWVATSIKKTQKIVSFDARVKLKRTNTTILCSNKQNNQELNTINHKSSFSNIMLNNCNFLDFKHY
jgi:hypothetical protein